MAAAGKPELAQRFQAASHEYRRGQKALRLINEAKADPTFLVGAGRRAIIDPDAMRRLVARETDEYGPSEFPALWRALSPGGAEFGARDIQRATELPYVHVGPFGVRTPRFRERLELPPSPPQRLPPAITGVLGSQAVGAARPGERK